MLTIVKILGEAFLNRDQWRLLSAAPPLNATSNGVAHHGVCCARKGRVVDLAHAREPEKGRGRSLRMGLPFACRTFAHSAFLGRRGGFSIFSSGYAVVASVTPNREILLAPQVPLFFKVVTRICDSKLDQLN